MRFEADDLDWAYGELLHLFHLAGRCRSFPHLIDPALFHEAWAVLNAQPFEVRNHCQRRLMEIWHAPVDLPSRFFGAKRYENALTH